MGIERSTEGGENNTKNEGRMKGRSKDRGGRKGAERASLSVLESRLREFPYQ